MGTLGYLNNVNHGQWKLFLDFHLQKYGGKVVFLSNLRPQDVPQLNLRDPFFTLRNKNSRKILEENLAFKTAKSPLGGKIAINTTID